MTEEDDRETRILLFGDAGQSVDIVDEDRGVFVLGSEVAEGVCVVDREAVAEVVIAIDGDAVLGKPSCHTVIAVDVLRHTVDELKDCMLRAQDATYGDGLDKNIRHPYMWACKSHYYSPDVHFYNFPYAFGGLFARGLYAQYEKEGAAFVPKYKKLLYTTTVATAEDTAKVAGIDLTDKEFWRAALQTIADCDYTVKIPMAHGGDSLNVAAASAVAFWQLGNPE